MNIFGNAVKVLSLPNVCRIIVHIELVYRKGYDFGKTLVN